MTLGYKPLPEKMRSVLSRSESAVIFLISYEICPTDVLYLFQLIVISAFSRHEDTHREVNLTSVQGGCGSFYINFIIRGKVPAGTIFLEKV